jgi:hypothetical protein
MLIFFRLLAVGLLAGCHSPPFHKSPVEYGSVPFWFGTNASVQMSAESKRGGAYRLYFMLQKNGVPRDESGRLPIWLDAPVHVLVLTNGQPALDKQVTRLHFCYPQRPEVGYSVTRFLIGPKTRVVCQVQDMSNAELRATGSLHLQQTYPK